MAMRWHKANNKLRDGRYMMLTAASRGVLADLEELLSSESTITANVSVWATWLGLDRKIIREAFEAIKASGLLAIDSEAQGKAGTFYTVSATHQPRTNTEATPHQPLTNPEPTPYHVPDKSGINAGLRADSLYRVEEKRIDSNTPLTPQGEGEEVPFSEPLIEQPESDEVPDDTPNWKKDSAFVAWWKDYPSTRRKGAPKAYALWRKFKLSARAATVMARLDEDKAGEQWTKEDGRFVPMPTTWLNLKRWEDDPAPQETGDNLLQFRRKPDEPEWLEKWMRGKGTMRDLDWGPLMVNQFARAADMQFPTGEIMAMVETAGLVATFTHYRVILLDALERKKANG